LGRFRDEGFATLPLTNDGSQAAGANRRTRRHGTEIATQRKIATAGGPFADQCWELLRTLQPSLCRVAAIVPSYNYAEYLDERLASIFTQTYPIYEIVVIDDASTDRSVDIIQRAAANAGRDITIRVNRENSGNVFRQWRAGLDLTSADH